MSHKVQPVELPARHHNAIAVLVGESAVVAAAEIPERYLNEWRGLYVGYSPLLIKPADTAEVSAVLAYCNEHGIAVVPQGGNSGLAGGAIPGLSGRAEVLLSLERLNSICEVDAANFVITVEAGCILANVQEAAAAAGRLFPLSLAAEGSCQIGGNISTNAGGTNVLRYGNTRDLVLGLEVVLADGRVLSNLSGVRKDNTGYDLKQLFIGAEGTLGVVTAASLKLFAQPKATATALLAVESAAQVVSLFSTAREYLGDELVAFEMFPDLAMQMLEQHLPGHQSPLQASHPWYVLLETAGSWSQAVIDEQLLGLLEEQLSAGCVVDGVVAQSESQRDDIWRLRHGISEAQKLAGASVKHDISVPVSRMDEFIGQASAAADAIVPGVRPVPFGHVGDGNIHFNLSQPESLSAAEFLALWEPLNEAVHALAVEFGGSFSAEHGIGYLKRNELQRLSGEVDIEVMRSLKAALDPNCILNPGKVLPE